VVYTEFGNLKKTASMEVGQVGFKSQKKVCTSSKSAQVVFEIEDSGWLRLACSRSFFCTYIMKSVDDA